MGLPGYVEETDEGAVVHVFVQPRAAKNAAVGVHGRALKLKVTAPAVDDRANRATLDLLADLLEVSRAGLSLVGGRASRNKRIAVSGLTPQAVATALSGVLSSRAHERGQEAGDF